MVSNLFTAFALIAAGRVELPPAPTQPVSPPQIRGSVRGEGDADEADKGRKRG
jgi:hypothetical protein